MLKDAVERFQLKDVFIEKGNYIPSIDYDIELLQNVIANCVNVDSLFV